MPEKSNTHAAIAAFNEITRPIETLVYGILRRLAHAVVEKEGHHGVVTLRSAPFGNGHVAVRARLGQFP